MDEWKKDARRDVVFVDIDALVPQDHLLRKIEKVMDYDWLYERLDPYYCHDNGRPGTDPVVLIKMVLIQHLYGIPSLRQTHQRIQDTRSYRWFLGYGLLDEIPHFATVSYAFCKRFPEELTEEIFTHILNKALNHRMVDPKMIFMDGTHIKASANKKKFQKEKVAKAAKVYAEQLREKVNAEREKLGKKPIEDEDDDDSTPGGGTVERIVSTTDPESGMFVKGDHERQFAYEAHTACDRKGFILGVEVTAGNVHDSVAWDALYGQVTKRFPEAEFITMDAGYKTPWIAKKTLDDGRIPILPYTNHHRKQDIYKPWEYEYDPKEDSFTCPHGGTLRHTTTDREGKRTYRSDTKHCKSCPFKAWCGANEKGQKILTTHIWQEYLDLVEQLRRTTRGKEIYAMRKETIERVFADAKEKHAMRYTHHRGLARVTSWVRLKYAAMNLKKLAEWSWNNSFLHLFFSLFPLFTQKSPLSLNESRDFFDTLELPAVLKTAGSFLVTYDSTVPIVNRIKVNVIKMDKATGVWREQPRLTEPFQKKDSHRPDATVSLTGTSLCTYAVEPPCTERYAWWCAAKAALWMREGPSAGIDRQTCQIALRRSVEETG